MKTTRSKDGTMSAYDVYGNGPAQPRGIAAHTLGLSETVVS
jgi:hypothetical protein